MLCPMLCPIRGCSDHDRIKLVGTTAIVTWGAKGALKIDQVSSKLEILVKLKFLAVGS